MARVSRQCVARGVFARALPRARVRKAMLPNSCAVPGAWLSGSNADAFAATNHHEVVKCWSPREDNAVGARSTCSREMHVAVRDATLLAPASWGLSRVDLLRTARAFRSFDANLPDFETSRSPTATASARLPVHGDSFVPAAGGNWPTARAPVRSRGL